MYLLTTFLQNSVTVSMTFAFHYPVVIIVGAFVASRTKAGKQCMLYSLGAVVGTCVVLGFLGY